MSEKSRVGFEGRMTADEAARQLEAIAQGLRKGYLGLSAQNRSIGLSPSGRVYFGLRAQGRKGGGSVEVTVAWRPERESGYTMLQVSSEMPETDAEPTPAAGERTLTDEEEHGLAPDEDD